MPTAAAAAVLLSLLLLLPFDVGRGKERGRCQLPFPVWICLTSAAHAMLMGMPHVQRRGVEVMVAHPGQRGEGVIVMPGRGGQGLNGQGLWLPLGHRHTGVHCQIEA